MTAAAHSGRTSLGGYSRQRRRRGFRSAVSLHAHTHHSREVLSDFPQYLRQIPLVNICFERAVSNHARRSGDTVDFANGWWRPPLSPRAVFESEHRQIEERFGLPALVSVTDHDDIAAGCDLQTWYSPHRAPISVEWTVPVGAGYFHLGVHNLPARSAHEWFERLAAATNRPEPSAIGALMHELCEIPEVLIVLNHPMWDLADVGAEQHTRLLGEFCGRYRRYMHAVELNGYRSWRENERARPLARDLGVPLISGGDRHGCDPNALLNLSCAATFDEFATEVREGVSHVVVMPEYERHIVTRKLGSAGDVLRHYTSYPPGLQRWTDRISWDDGSGPKSLATRWPAGVPRWLPLLVQAFRLVTNPVALTILDSALRGSETIVSVTARTPRYARALGTVGLGDVR